MSSLLEKSLDEIIGSGNQNTKNGNNRRRNFKAGKSSVSKPHHNSRVNNARKPRNRKFAGKPNEIKITNLHPDLTENDLGRLMETMGPLETVEIKLNTHGKSTGVAFVNFVRGKDAIDAVKKFDGRLAAGQVINVSSTMSLFDRISTNQTSKKNAPPKNAKRQNKDSKPKREKKSLEDLDNELSMYMNGDVSEAQPEAQPQAAVSAEVPVAFVDQAASEPAQESAFASVSDAAPAPAPTDDVPME